MLLYEDEWTDVLIVGVDKNSTHINDNIFVGYSVSMSHMVNSETEK